MESYIKYKYNFVLNKFYESIQKGINKIEKKLACNDINSDGRKIKSKKEIIEFA